MKIRSIVCALLKSRKERIPLSTKIISSVTLILSEKVGSNKFTTSYSIKYKFKLIVSNEFTSN